jgi:type VI secretion system protein ImpA
LPRRCSGRDGVQGLTTGLESLRAILERYWDGCYPVWDEEDPELRAGPLDWVGSKLEIPVRQTAIAPGGVSLLDYHASRAIPSESEAEGNKEKRTAREEALGDGKRSPEDVDGAIAGAGKAFYKTIIAEADTALAAVVALEKTSDERFGRDAPSFIRLRAALDDIRRVSAPILAQKLIDDPDPIVEEAAAGERRGAPADGPLTPEPVSVADAASRVATAARYLRKLDPTNPAPYLMLRFALGRAARACPRARPKLLEAPPRRRARLRASCSTGSGPICSSSARRYSNAARARLARSAAVRRDRVRPSGHGYDGVAAVVRSELRVLLAAFLSCRDDAHGRRADANGETRLAGRAGVGGSAGGCRGKQRGRCGQAGQRDHGPVRGARRRAGREDATSEAWRVAQRDAAPHPMTVTAPARDRSRPRAASSPRTTERAIELLVAELARERSPRAGSLGNPDRVCDGGSRTRCRRTPDSGEVDRQIDGEASRTGNQVRSSHSRWRCLRVLDRLGDGSGDRDGYYLRICRLDLLQAMRCSGRTADRARPTWHAPRSNRPSGRRCSTVSPTASRDRGRPADHA